MNIGQPDSVGIVETRRPAGVTVRRVALSCDTTASITSGEPVKCSGPSLNALRRAVPLRLWRANAIRA